MLLRLVRPVRRKESSKPYLTQRIPVDVKAKAAGLKLAIPVGDEIRHLTISPQASSIKLSLLTREPEDLEPMLGPIVDRKLLEKGRASSTRHRA